MSNKNDRWSALSMKERADLINMYITNGISDLKEMKKHYNSFGDGGNTEDDEKTLGYTTTTKQDLEDVETFNSNWYKYRDKQLADAVRGYYAPQHITRGLSFWQNSFPRFVNDTKLANGARNYINERLEALKEFTIEEAVKDKQAKQVLIDDYYSYFPNERTENEVEIGPPRIPNNQSLINLNNLIYKGGYSRPAHLITYSNGHENTSTKIHERAHASIYQDVLGYHSVLKPIRNVVLKQGVNAHKYYDKLTEVYSRLMQLRFENNIDPAHTYTLDEIKAMRNDPNFKDHHIFDRYTDESILMLLNEVAHNTTDSNRLDYTNPENIAANGGKLNSFSGEENTKQTSNGKPASSLKQTVRKVKAGVMDILQKYQYEPLKEAIKDTWYDIQLGTGSKKDYANNEYEDVAQDSFLFSRKEQKDAFLNSGYIEGAAGDYGLVAKAVGNRNLPVYQSAKDDITRDKLTVIGNLSNMFFGDDGELFHAGNYPTALYKDADGNVYQKAWDLQDYGPDSTGTGGYYSQYPTIKQLGSKILDMVGNPVVRTTGFKQISDDMLYNLMYQIKDSKLWSELMNTKASNAGNTVMGERVLEAYEDLLFMKAQELADKENREYSIEDYDYIKKTLPLEIFKSNITDYYDSKALSEVYSIFTDENKFETGGQTESLYYDDTYIEPSVVTAESKKAKRGKLNSFSGEEDTNKSFLQKLLESGQSARDAKIGALGAQQVRDLYNEGKSEEAQELAKQYAKANTTGIALAGGAASTGLLGDLIITGATTTADTLLEGNVDRLGTDLLINGVGDILGHGIGKYIFNKLPSNISEEATNKIKALLNRFPEGVESVSDISKDLKERLIKEGVDPKLLTKSNLKKMTYLRSQDVLNSNAPSKFAGRESSKISNTYNLYNNGDDGVRQIGYVTAYPENGIGNIRMIENITDHTSNRVGGVSELGYNTVIKDIGASRNGAVLMEPDKTMRVLDKYPDKKIISNDGEWLRNGKYTEGNPVYLLQTPTYDVPIKYLDDFSVEGLDESGMFLFDFTKGPLLKNGGKLTKKCK